MKKWALALLCVFLAAAILGGGAAWLLLTPRGLLREDRPEDVMQGVLNDMRRDEWRDTYVRECPVETGEFEDSAEVTGRIFDAAVPGEEFSFRPSEDGTGETTQTYIISGGGVDLMRADLVYDSRHWNLALTGLCTLRGETRTITVTAPEGTALTLNGRPVGEQYIVERDIPYPDMTELELRFASHPTLVRYEIGGIYEAAELRAEREGGLTELYSDGTEWRYTLPEGGKYVFSVKAPLEAVVTVNGTQLTDREIAATTTYPTVLDIPQELEASLPSYCIYTAGGLYTEPVISAALPDGSELLSETAEDGSVAYTYPPSEALREEAHARVEDFLRALCEYGAGHTARYAPNAYVVQDSPLSRYITRASASLYWTVGVATSYDEITSSDYVPLGSDTFLCRGHVACSTKTRYQTVTFDLNYEMLWLRQGNRWMIQDLAFDKYEASK